jgi:plastocyanin
VSRTSWRALLRWAALVGVVESVIVMTAVEEAAIPPVIVIAVVLLVGAVLLPREGPAGVRVATIGFALFLLSTLLFASFNLVVPASFGSFAVSWASFVTGIVGVIAGIASWRGRTAGVMASRVVGIGVALTVVAVVIGLVASLGYNDASARAGDVAIRAKSSKFIRSTLVASSGKVSFFLDNADNTLHNFHLIGVKGGKKDMPANHKTRLTVDLTSGTYKYRCDFHEDMKGTLRVS